MKEPLTAEHGLVWTLLLVEAAEKAGLAPFDSVMLHRLQFLSNTLAPVYGATPPLQLVKKMARGPYYPSSERDADHLAVMGLLDMSGVQWLDPFEQCSKYAKYELTDLGGNLCDQLRSDLEWCSAISKFLTDLCFAAATLDTEEVKSAVLSDLTFMRPGYSEGGVVPFQHERGNPTFKAASAFEKFFPSGFTVTHRQQLVLYMGFLEQVDAAKGRDAHD